MDPSMTGAPPMDPSAQPPSLEQEIASIKDMLQQLMDAQIAMMQALAPGMMAGPGMPPPGAPPMDPSMMGASPMDPSMMGGGMPPPGMVAQASYDDEDREKFAEYMKSITDLLR